MAQDFRVMAIDQMDQLGMKPADLARLCVENKICSRRALYKFLKTTEIGHVKLEGIFELLNIAASAKK